MELEALSERQTSGRTAMRQQQNTVCEAVQKKLQDFHTTSWTELATDTS